MATLVARINDLATVVRDKINLMVPRLIPSGGTTGQVLGKTSATDYAVSWQTSSGGAGSNTVRVSVNFGASFTDKVQVVVTGQTWVTSTSNIVSNILTPVGADPDEMILLDMKAYISDLVEGVGFTLTVYCESEARGAYEVMCLAV